MRPDSFHMTESSTRSEAITIGMRRRRAHEAEVAGEAWRKHLNKMLRSVHSVSTITRLFAIAREQT